MLACGEDLGMVPDCVPGVMDREKILTLKMRGFENKGDWNAASVCATSSHDMDTLRMQCAQDPEPSECRRMLSELLDSPSMLAIFPIQDWLSVSAVLRRKDRSVERINHPENPAHHWCWRLHLNVDDLLADSAFRIQMKEMLKDSRRFGVRL